jgi:protein TonB
MTTPATHRRTGPALAVLLVHLGLGWGVLQGGQHVPGQPATARPGPSSTTAAVLNVRLLQAETRQPPAPVPAPPSRPLPGADVPQAQPLPVPAVTLAAAPPAALAAISGPSSSAADSTRLPAPTPPFVTVATAATAATAATITTASPAPAQPAAPPPQRRQAADHRHCEPARYPAALRERGIEGELRLRVQVAPDGRATEVRLLVSSGWRLFDEAALAQARGCQFQPARLGDTAVADWVEFPVRFRLDG